MWLLGTFKLAVRPTCYEQLFTEDQDRRNASKGTYYRDPNYQVATVEAEDDQEVGRHCQLEAVCL